MDEALALSASVLPLEKCSVGEKHAKTATTYKNIGLVQGKKGDFESAMMNLEKALEIQEAVFGSYHPDFSLFVSAGDIFHRRVNHIDHRDI
mgnify:CR=1 FL=1